MDLRIKRTWKEYGRGIIGGLLFSLPLLYTEELWWVGFMASPEKLLAIIGVTLILLMGYNRYAGMRRDSNRWEIFRDSVEEICLALFLSFLFLALVGKIGPRMSLDEIAGKVIVESMIVAIGISVGTAQLGKDGQQGKGMKKDGKDRNENQGLPQVLILSFCGAALFSASVAPTDEILELAMAVTFPQLILMVLLSLLLGLVTLFHSDFKNTGAQVGPWEIGLHLIICYSASLIVSLMFLWLFGRTHGGMHQGVDFLLAQLVVLSIPGSLGASAGRLLIK